MRRKSSAQLDREIAEVVPGWARGLDLSESRRLAATLRISPEELARKERAIASQRIARLPSLRIKVRTGREPGSTLPRGVYVYVSSPGVAYSNVRAVADVLEGLGYAPRVEPSYVFLEFAGVDLGTAADRIAEAFRGRGYRVEVEAP